MTPLDRGHGPAVITGDRHDEALVGEVHPTDWVNPAPKDRYHLVVIGAGTGGLVTAAEAAGLGAKVALVEGHLMGGDRLNVGCLPSKGVLAAARGWYDARTAAARFGGPAVSGPGDFAKAMERMRTLRARLAPADGAARFRSLGVDVFLGQARFDSPGSVEVAGARLRFRRAVIATGARPAVPSTPGLAQVGFLTNETVFTLTECPGRLVVVGGGPVGTELAQAFRRFGAEVTILTRASRLLPRDDPKASQLLRARFEWEGIRVVTDASIERVEPAGGGAAVTVSSGGATARVETDRLLIATGRVPNVDDLGLDRAGVAVVDGRIAVDDRLRTANPAIFAVGDVCSKRQFTHAADWQARLVIRNALFFGRRRASALVIPWCTYTSPEIAQVGLTEEAARATNQPVDVVEVDFEHLDRAVLEGEAAGFLKVLVARGSDRIVGATLVGSRAGDMIGELAVAMTNRLGLGAIGRTVHPYPTQGEIFRKAADQWQRQRRVTPAAQGLLRRWFNLFR